MSGDVSVRVAAAVKPLFGLRLIELLRLFDLTKLGDAARALAELFAMPKPSLDDPQALRAWVVKALDIAATVATATRDGWDDEAVATLRKWLEDGSILDAIIDVVTRYMGGAVHMAEDAPEPIAAKGLPPALISWMLGFLLDLLVARLARD